MTWEIFTFGGGDFLRMIFNSVAMIFGNGSYMGAMKTISLGTFLAIMFQVAFNKDGMANFRYIMSMIFFINIILIPKTNIVITDKVEPANSAVVANVPLGVAMLAGTASHVGYWMTSVLETAFSLPSQLKPSQTGFLFHDKMVKSLNKFTITDERTSENFSEFFSSCVIVDGIGHDRFSYSQMMKSTNLDSFLKSNLNNNVAGFFYKDTSGNKLFQMCRDGYSKISNDMVINYPDYLKNAAAPYIEDKKFILKSLTDFDTRISSTMSYLFDSALPKDAIVKQFLLKNSIDPAMAAFSSNVDEKSIQDYIIAKTNVERDRTFSSVGKISSEKIPLLRVIIEAMVYALFPLVALLAIASPLKVSLAYVKAVIWVNLWMPMFALLHFARVYFDMNHLASIGSLNGGLTINVITDLNSYLSQASALTGYLMASIPMIAWMLLSGGASLAGIATKALDGYEKSAEKATDETIQGTLKANGQTINMVRTFGQAERENAALMSQASSGGGVNGAQSLQTLGTGTVVTRNADGSSNMVQDTSRLQVMMQAASSVNNANALNVAQATSYVEQTSSTLAKQAMATLSSANSAGKSLSTGKSSKDSTTHSNSQAYSQALQQVRSSIDAFAKQKGLSEKTAALAAYKLALDAGIGGNIGIGKLGGGGEAAWNSSTQAEKTDAMTLMNSFLTSDSGVKSVTSAAQMINSASLESSKAKSNTSSSIISDSLNKLHSASEQHSKAVATQESAQRAYSLSSAFQQNISIDQASKFVATAKSKFGLSDEEIDQLVYKVRNNDSSAIEQFGTLIKTMAEGSDLTGLLIPKALMEKTYTDLNNRGAAQVELFATQNNESVNQTAQSNRSIVQGSNFNPSIPGGEIPSLPPFKLPTLDANPDKNQDLTNMDLNVDPKDIVAPKAIAAATQTAVPALTGLTPGGGSAAMALQLAASANSYINSNLPSDNQSSLPSASRRALSKKPEGERSPLNKSDILIGRLSKIGSYIDTAVSGSSFNSAAVTALMFIESKFDATAKSPSGASGLGQFTRSTFAEVVRQSSNPVLSSLKNLTPEQLMLKRFNPLISSVATVEYMEQGKRSLMAAFKRFGLTDPPTLAEIYSFHNTGNAGIAIAARLGKTVENAPIMNLDQKMVAISNNRPLYPNGLQTDARQYMRLVQSKIDAGMAYHANRVREK